MPIDPNTLTPYKSLLLCSVPPGITLTGLAQAIANEISALVNVPPTQVHAVVVPPKNAGLEIALFDYREEKQVAWTTTAILDQLHHLVIVCRLRRKLAIVVTDAAFRDKVVRVVGSQNGTDLGRMRSIHRGTLNAAFVSGKTKTLWLSNTRRGTQATVDSKIIAGDDLRYALDPLLDQSFLFSAIRCLPLPATYGQTIGMSPRKSMIWAGASNDFASFCQSVARLLDLVDGVAAPVDDPLPILATPLQDGVAIATVGNAFDAAVTPMELLDYGLSDQDRTDADKWSRLSFDVTALAGPNLSAEIAFPDLAGVPQPIGTVEITFDVADPTRITATAIAAAGAAVHNQGELDLALAMLNRKHHWLRVWYETGHSFADGSFSTMRLRDRPFAYSWADFAAFDVTREKPVPLNPPTIGTQDSLFCWVKSSWRPDLNPASPQTGWLACNDGALEIADFIHFDDAVAGEEALTLIHVKASKKGGAARALSVSDFEIVVSQAEKNLRFLEMHWLSGEFALFLNNNLFDAVWHNGAPALRNNMLAAMQGVPFPNRLNVIIVQPRIRQTAEAAATAAAANSKARRQIRQLNTLLLSAQAACRSVGAELQVIGDVI